MIVVTYKGYLLPKKATKGSYCYDLKSAEDIVLKPKAMTLVPLGIKTNFNWKLYIRSSLALKHGLMLGNGVGIIDKDYRKEVGMIIYNTTDEEVLIKNGEKIAQMEIDDFFDNIEFVVDKHLYERFENIFKVDGRNGGFGSTGRF